MAQNDINVKIRVDASQAEQQTINVRKRMKELMDQMTQLQLQGKANTAEYAAAAKELGNLKDAISDTAAQARIMSDDFFKSRAAMEGLSVGLNVFSGLSQAAALCGLENTALTETLTKLQAAQNLANTAMNISKALNKDTALMTALRDVKEKLLTKTINTETKSQLALNAAKAGAIGVIVALTAAVVALGVAYVKSRNSVESMNRELNKQAAESVADTVIEVRNLKEGWDALGGSLEDRKKYLEQNAEALEKLGLNFKDVNEAEQFFRDNTEKYIEAQTQRAKAAAAMEMIVEQQKKQLQNENDMNRMLSEEASWWDKLIVSVNGGEEAIRKMNEGLDSGINKNIKNLQNLKKAAEDTAAAIEQSIPGYETPEQKAERQKQEKEKEESAKKAADERKRQRDDLNKFIEDSQKAELQREKELNKETHEGRLKNIEIEKEETTSLYDQRIADAEKLFGKESEQVQQIKQLKENALTELQNKRLTEIQEELDAQKKAADEKAEADAKAQKESERAAKDEGFRIAKAKSEGNLIGLKEGSEEYNKALEYQYATEYNIAIEELNRQHEDGLISEEEYLAKKELLEKEYQVKIDSLTRAAEAKRVEDRISQAENLISQLNTLTSAASEAELTTIENKMNAELELVGDNEEKRKEIQEKYAKEEAEARKKYAKINFLSQIASIGIDTAKGIMSIWSTAGEAGLGAPAYGAAMTALITATGIAQTAQAKAAMDKALSGKAARGAFVKGRSHAEGGELYELEGGEAVLNKQAMSVPAFRALASAMNQSTGGVAFDNISASSPMSNKSLISANVSEDTVQRIVQDTISGITSIPVVVTEAAITEAQRNVNVTTSRSRF